MTGRLGAVNLPAGGSGSAVYTCPPNTFSVVTLNICNRGSVAVTIRVAIAAASTPLDAEYIEFETSLSPKGVLERTGLVLDEGKILVVRSSATDVSAVAYGIETSTA